MKKDQLVIDKNLINYYKMGIGERTIIFLHGWRSESLVWKPIVGGLTEGFCCYMLDLPGFGSSPLTKESYDLDDYANVVTDFIKKLGITDPIIVGHSFGGRIAIKLCSSKNNVSKMVLVDSAGFVNKKRGLGYISKIVKPIFKLAFMQGFRKKIYKSIGAEDYIATPELQKTFLNVINEDLSEQLGKITAPTLIIWGENDFDTPLSYALKMKKNISQSKLAILPKAGHFSFLDSPIEFKKELIGFIND